MNLCYECNKYIRIIAISVMYIYIYEYAYNIICVYIYVYMCVYVFTIHPFIHSYMWRLFESRSASRLFLTKGNSFQVLISNFRKVRWPPCRRCRGRPIHVAGQTTELHDV